jgi:hypothetical protein
MMMKIP